MALTRSMRRSLNRVGGSSGSADASWQTISTDSGDTPSTTAFTLGANQDSFTLYLDDLCEGRPAGFVRFYLDIGGTVKTLVAAPYQAYKVYCGESGVAVKISADYLTGAGVVWDAKICKGRMPFQWHDPASLVVTGTVHSDWSSPLEWTPETYRVLLSHGGQWLAIDGTSWTKQTVVWVKEKDGSNVSPIRAIICPPGRETPFFVEGSEVAVMTLDGIDVPVKAPFDTYVDTLSASDVLDIDDFVPNGRSPINVSTGGEFDAAIADLQDGDDIVVSTSITITDIDLTGVTQTFRIRGNTGDPVDVTITGGISIGGSDSTVATVYLSGVSFQKSRDSIAFYLYQVSARLQRVNLAKTGGAGANVWEWNNTIAGRDFKAFRCSATGTISAYSSDVWNFRLPGGGSAHLISSNGSVAGPNSNSNLVTSHNGGHLYVWGGTYTDPGSSGPAFTADAATSPISLIGIYTHDGSTVNGIKVGSQPLAMVFGCEIRDLGDASSCYCSYRSIGNRITTGGGAGNYFLLSDDTEIFSFVGNVVIHANNAGTFLYVQQDWWVIAGNQFRRTEGLDSADGNAFARAIDVRVDSDLSTGDAGLQWMLCNWSRSESANYWRNGDQSGVCYCLGNVASSLDGVTSSVDAKNFLFEGNLASGSIGNSIAVNTTTNFRNSVTPIRNKSSEAFDEGTEFDAEGTPLSGGQFEWSTFTSGLSGANAQTLRDRLPLDLGLMDAFGGSLFDHGDRFTLGPIPIRERVEAVGLYPVRG